MRFGITNRMRMQAIITPQDALLTEVDFFEASILTEGWYLVELMREKYGKE